MLRKVDKVGQKALLLMFASEVRERGKPFSFTNFKDVGVRSMEKLWMCQTKLGFVLGISLRGCQAFKPEHKLLMVIKHDCNVGLISNFILSRQVFTLAVWHNNGVVLNVVATG